jgi:hypothetical protein
MAARDLPHGLVAKPTAPWDLRRSTALTAELYRSAVTKR